MDQEVEAELARHRVAELDHLAELPPGIDVEDRKRDAAGKERLAGQMQQNGRILADRVHHHRPLEARRDFAEDFDTLGLEGLEVAEATRADGTHWRWEPCCNGSEIRAQQRGGKRY
jgi:hypothetical protein